MNNPWVINPDERSKHAAQFASLKPVNGFITGDQARNYFFLSKLPAQVLAHIWNLADINKDGKMDIHEFSIAVCLIQRKLTGFNLPPNLPDSLRPNFSGSGTPIQGVGGYSMSQSPAPSMGSGMGSPAMAIQGMQMQPPPGVGMGTSPGMHQMGGYGITPPSGGFPSMGSSPLMPSGFPAVQPSPPNQQIAGGSILPNPNRRVDWAMPPASKLRHSQMFNSLDKGRVGFLSGIHARNIMSQSGLPHVVLAQVWSLSDVDKDGKLTCDEFCIAMHLIDRVKGGETDLPQVLPPELRPSTTRARTTSIGGVGVPGGVSLPPIPGAEGQGGNIVEAPLGDDAGESPRQAPLTFDEKLQQNRDRAQVEIERRRQVLQEQERREREERERKEREEEERRERERQEQERKRQAELEKELARQREIEQVREAERRRIFEQKRAAQEEMEKQRQSEMDRLKLQELRQQHLRDQEAVCHLKQKEKNLKFQVQALNETSAELNQQILEVRTRMMSITSEIESKRPERDGMSQSLTGSKGRMAQAHQQLQLLAAERAKLKARLGSTEGGGGSTTLLLSQVNEAVRVREAAIASAAQNDVRLTDELSSSDGTQTGKRSELDVLKSSLGEQRQEQQGFMSNVSSRQANIRSARGYDQPPASVNHVTGSAGGVGSAGGIPPSVDADGHRIGQYRALYAFTGQNDDELCFQPGDMITVFLDHTTEPGWLAGQFHGKVGWFPAAYAEDMGAAAGSTGEVAGVTPSIPGRDGPVTQIAGGQVSVLDGIHEESSSVLDGSDASVGGSLERSKTQDSVGTQESQRSVSTVKEQPIGGGGGMDGALGGLIAQAQYPWKAKKDEQLTFSKGDMITIVEQDEMWWKGEIQGRTGWFPKSYVKLKNGPSGGASITDSRRGSKLESPSTEQPPSEPMSRKESVIASEPSVGGAPSSGHVYIAVYPFAASESGDLEFQAGDRITVISKEGDWWTGQLNGREGIFPANYVEETEEGAAVAVDVSPQQSAPTAPGAVAADGDAAAVPGPTRRQASIVSNRSSISGELDQQYEVAQVIAPFQPTSANQLTLAPGDIVKVRAKSPNGWWEGELNRAGQDRRAGWFPGNFVKILGNSNNNAGGGKEPLSAKTSSASVHSRASTTSSIKPPRQASDANGNGPADATGAGGNATTNGATTGGAEGGWYEALFDYTPQQDDELFLTAGTRLKIIGRDSDAWWHGVTLAGQEGLFPANYVQPVATTDGSAGMVASDSQTGQKGGFAAPEDQTFAASAPQTASSPTNDVVPNADSISGVVRDASEEQLDLRTFEQMLRNEIEKGGEEAEENSVQRKQRRALEELVETEKNYIDDLEMVKRVFFDALRPDGPAGIKITAEEHAVLQGNWKDLQRVAKKFYKAIRPVSANDPRAIGQTVLDHLPDFQAFLDFCAHQQDALDFVDKKSAGNPAFLKAYTECTQHPAARGLPLSYYILIPMTRIIRYPLLLEKLIKYTNSGDDPDGYALLVSSVDRLKTLCTEVDQIVSQFQSLQMLHWCQQHVKCETILPPLVFNSQTHELGARAYVHAGVLYKAKSGRLLIALLFNDILLLTTPDEQIDHPSSFKLTRSSDTELTVYRTPILLKDAKLSSLVSSSPAVAGGSGTASSTTSATAGTSSTSSSVEEDQSFTLTTSEFAVNLKATSMSAKTLWMKELGRAIEASKQQISGPENPASGPGVLGRLLLEIMPPQGVFVPEGFAQAPKLLLQVACDAQLQTLPVPSTCLGGGAGTGKGGGSRSSVVSSPTDDRITTQVFIRNKESQLTITFLLEQLYAPDLSLGQLTICLNDLIKESGFSRNPTLRQFPLANQVFTPPDGNTPNVVLKYVFHLLESS